MRSISQIIKGTLLFILVFVLGVSKAFSQQADSLVIRYLDSLTICINEASDNEDFATALQLRQEHMSCVHNYYGEYSIEYAEDLWRFNNAKSYLERDEDDSRVNGYHHAVSILDSLHLQSSYLYYDLLECLYNSYYFKDDYVKAYDYLSSAISAAESIIGVRWKGFTVDTATVATLYFSRGELCRSIDSLAEYSTSDYQRCINYLEDFSDKGLGMISLGICYFYLDNYPKSLECYLESLPNIEKSIGPEHPDYVSCLANIGISYYAMGDYLNALEYFRQTLTASEIVLGMNHPYYARCLNYIGSCYDGLGNSNEAAKYYHQGLMIMENSLGKEHPEYASCLSNIGDCYINMGKYQEAAEYYLQALEIIENSLGKERPSFTNNYRINFERNSTMSLARDYALYVDRLGDCFYYSDDDSSALEYYQYALEINEEILGKKDPGYASNLVDIADCYADLGEYDKALGYYQQALAIKEEVYGKDHLKYATTLKDIGLLYFETGDYANAQKNIVTYTEIAGSFVKSCLPSLTASAREMFWQMYSFFFTNKLFRITDRIASPEMYKTAFDGALLGKGLLLNTETEMRQLINESNDNEALNLYAQLYEGRICLDKLYHDPVGKKDQIDSLTMEIDILEQALIKRSKAFGDFTKNLSIKWTDVQNVLKKGDIAIEFASYSVPDTTFYIALTLKEGYSEPHFVGLFNSEELKKVPVRSYYKSPIITELVWGKLSNELIGIKNVYFSPAGELNNIGIEYLMDEDRHMVSEKRNYYRLTSTRELVKNRVDQSLSNATLYGGIRYDITPVSNLTGNETETETIAKRVARSVVPLDSISGNRGSWAVYLPETKDEVEAISSTLVSMKVYNDLFEGEQGTEESFKDLSGKKRDVIHVATHGFYWKEFEIERRKERTESFLLSDDTNAPKEDKALTRSGLLFAGAQNSFDGKEIPLDVEDGILTAKEISRMDLRGTDLVVLSACQSGLGEISGDGVFGLQRGFKKAGVHSLVMSLWEVDDTATKILMTRFYENLARGQKKYIAFRNAQKYLRQYDHGAYDYPEYYAAFVLLDALDN